ncbi:MAG: hypothetical protein SF053_10100 [Bacteroidia bacterium]|nr:hypothetical protein [Bacteroidia bacterium]
MMTFLKNNLMFVATLSVLNVVAVSCGDVVAPSLTASEAADLVSNAVVSGTEGLTVQVEDMSSLATTYLSYCNQALDSSVTRTGGTAPRSYAYTFDWDWLLTCNQVGVPTKMDFSWASDGTYSLAAMNSDDAAEGTFAVTGLQPSITILTFNGKYVRTGTQNFTGRNAKSTTSTLEMTVLNLTYDEGQDEITGGTAEIELTGAVTGGSSFSFTGTLTFNGNQSATLVINGTSYPISW